MKLSDGGINEMNPSMTGICENPFGGTQMSTDDGRGRTCKRFKVLSCAIYECMSSIAC